MGMRCLEVQQSCFFVVFLSLSLFLFPLHFARVAFISLPSPFSFQLFSSSPILATTLIGIRDRALSRGAIPGAVGRFFSPSIYVPFFDVFSLLCRWYHRVVPFGYSSMMLRVGGGSRTFGIWSCELLDLHGLNICFPL